MITINWLAKPTCRAEALRVGGSSESEGWSLWSDSHRRLRVYKTRPVAAEAQRQVASTAGIAPAASTFAWWRSDLTELRGQLSLGGLVSVAGLAPAKVCLKGRALDLLCIHGRKVHHKGTENTK